jgi:hypothetical protein
LPRYHQQGTCSSIEPAPKILMEIATFSCSICGEASSRICVYCTKDTCGNHLCERCLRCSDCCECELRLTAEDRDGVHKTVLPVETTAPPE